MDSLETLRDLVAALVPGGIAFAVAVPEVWNGTLPPAEEIFVAGATLKRKREFGAGRTCARLALQQLGCEAVALPSGADRYPVWPAGVVGSISHCDGCAVAVVARRERAASLGVDVERSGRVGERLLADITTRGERRHVRDLGGSSGCDWSTLAFSAKESFYKCYRPVVKQELNFHDVEVQFDLLEGTFVARLVNPNRPPLLGRSSIAGRFSCDASHVATGIFVTGDC